MQWCADSIRVSRLENGAALAVERIGQPLLRYNHELRFVQEASLWAWGVRGRPQALMAMEVSRTGISSPKAHYTCVSLADGPLTLDRSLPEWHWAPQTPGVKLKQLAGAPAPHQSEQGRFEQMKTLVARFSAVEVQRQDFKVALHLLPQATYRYSELPSGLIDGALFFIAQRGAPEVVVVLEAHREEDASKWFYALARLTQIGLSVSLDDREIWTAPSDRRPAADELYWIAPPEMYSSGTLK